MVEHESPESGKAGVDLKFSEEEKRKLREVAFEAIRCRCMGQTMPEVATDSPRLKAPGAAFVCIHKGKELRGCIGMIEALTPLLETVRHMAVEAAFADPRFCALSPEELDGIDIEISVLTPRRRISGPEEIEIGKHGLIIRKGFNSGLLLPQVATEHNLDAKGFLQWTCHKAGLHKDAWKESDVEIYAFSADVF